MIATMGVNLFVSWYEAREGRRLQSAFLLADSAHTRADLYVSLGVVALLRRRPRSASAGPTRWWRWRSPRSSPGRRARILLSAFNVLTDRAVIPAEMLEPLAAAVPGVLRVHDVRSRGRRDAVYVDLTVHLDGAMSLRQAHDVADRIEAALAKAHPEIVDVVVHLEPEGHEGPPRRASEPLSPRGLLTTPYPTPTLVRRGSDDPHPPDREETGHSSRSGSARRWAFGRGTLWSSTRG